MVRKFTKLVIDYITEDKYSKEECLEMEYILNTILFEVIKMSMIILLFSIFGYLKECLILIISTCSIRPFIGGYHEDNQMRCFIASLLFTVLGLVLSKQTHLSFSANLIVIILCIFCIYQKAPIINPEMPITRSKAIQNNRKKGLTNAVILGITSLALHNYEKYYLLITWTLLINTLLMFNKRKSVKNEE